MSEFTGDSASNSSGRASTGFFGVVLGVAAAAPPRLAMGTAASRNSTPATSPMVTTAAVLYRRRKRIWALRQRRRVGGSSVAGRGRGLVHALDPLHGGGGANSS